MVILMKDVVLKQMDPAQVEAVKQVVEEKVEVILEEKKEEIHEKVEEVAKKIDAEADKVAEKVEKSAEIVIDKLEEVVPGGAAIVEAVDSALVGVGFSCGCLGWKFSVEKTARKPLK